MHLNVVSAETEYIERHAIHNVMFLKLETEYVLKTNYGLCNILSSRDRSEKPGSRLGGGLVAYSPAAAQNV